MSVPGTGSSGFYVCEECGNPYLYKSDHKPDCSNHPNAAWPAAQQN